MTRKNWLCWLPYKLSGGWLLECCSRHHLGGCCRCRWQHSLQLNTSILALFLLVPAPRLWAWTKGRLAEIWVNSSSSFLRHWATHEIDPKVVHLDGSHWEIIFSFGDCCPAQPHMTYCKPTVYRAMTHCANLFIGLILQYIKITLDGLLRGWIYELGNWAGG